MTTLPAVTIRYCSQCNWLLRAAWMAQELLQTFNTDLASVTLVPGSGGIYEITVEGEVLWDRKTDGGFPDAAQLKQRLRDRCFPERALGHADKNAGGNHSRKN
ncbi:MULTISPECIES: SelT/SelW/SelH family protein [Sodalis]|uniref:Selenoprotein W-related protein n=1 Tax=Sodalis ligni TaxID=2697027 RepID=A0A4R1N6Y7_9GAMM|nr:SelT/SelW/SelH family protein [Sodalis ligni]TCL02892.1 selenoprotein W-related protein [Sodalis ligni]